jgi:hypothetical protein
VIDTADPVAEGGSEEDGETREPGQEIRLPPRSTRLLVQCGAA